MAELVEKTPPAGVKFQKVSLLGVKLNPHDVEYANSPNIIPELVEVEVVGLLDVKREPDDVEYANSQNVQRELVEVEVASLELKREPVDLDLGSACVKREATDVEGVSDRDVASTAREHIDIEVTLTQPENNQYVLSQGQQNLVEDQPAGMSNSGLLDPVDVESGNVLTKRAVIQKQDGAMLQGEFRGRQSAEEKKKRKTAYMREFRARRKRQSDVPRDVMKRRELAETVDIENLKDTIANDQARASTSIEYSENLGNFSAQKRATTNKTILQVPPNETITVPVEWDDEHQEHLTQNSLRFQPISQDHTMTQTHDKQCHICRKSFRLNSKLRNHLLTHSGEKNHQCNICKKSFAAKSNLKIHILTHTGKKPYQCNACEKSFTAMSKLKVHCLKHTGERPHVCDICQKSFTHSSTLKTHVLAHSGKRPYLCNVCDKGFTQASSLKAHSLIHTGEKPHQCDICKKVFPQSSKLKLHILTHTGEKPYHCEICKKSFNQCSSLKRHMLTHSGENRHR